MGNLVAGNFLVASGDVTVILPDFGQVQGVIFFGSNQATEDAVVTNTNAGVFMGMMVNDEGTILSQCNSVIPQQGQQSKPKPIVMQAAWNTIEYEADAVSLDVDEFTINFTSVPGGARRIHYLAWGDYEDSEGRRSDYDSIITDACGFNARASFYVGCWTTDGLGGMNWDYQNTMAWWGGGAYADVAHGGHTLWSCASITTMVYSPFSQGAQVLQRSQQAAPIAYYAANFVSGPFMSLVSNTMYPTHPLDTTFRLDSTPGGAPNSTLCGYWTCDSDTGFADPDPTAGNTYIADLGIDTNADAVILFTLSNQQSGFSTSNPVNGVGFAVKTADYQACVIANYGGYFYQSRSRAWISNVGAAGVHAGTIDLNGSEFTMETIDDDVVNAPMVWVAYTQEDPWIPQIYRVQYT